MTPAIERVERGQLLGLISSSPAVRLNTIEAKVMKECAGISRNIWAGFLEDDFVCAWGLIPPTLLSDQAYLWLFTTPIVEDEKFLFVRHSQRQVEEMLKHYPKLVGYCEAGNTQAIRWIKWLGGVFQEEAEGKVQFCIRSRDNG